MSSHPRSSSTLTRLLACGLLLPHSPFLLASLSVFLPALNLGRTASAQCLGVSITTWPAILFDTWNIWERWVVILVMLVDKVLQFWSCFLQPFSIHSSPPFSSFISLFPLIAPIDICYARFSPLSSIQKCLSKLTICQIFPLQMILQPQRHITLWKLWNSTLPSPESVYISILEIFTDSLLLPSVSLARPSFIFWSNEFDDLAGK